MNHEQAVAYLNNLLKAMISKDASDLFISVDFPPSMKIHGKMTPVTQQKLSAAHSRALADAAMGIAFGRTLLDSEDFSTIEMKVNFIRPVREGLLTAKAKVTQRGLRVGFLECQVTNAAGKLVATSTCTCMVISE